MYKSYRRISFCEVVAEDSDAGPVGEDGVPESPFDVHEYGGSCLVPQRITSD